MSGIHEKLGKAHPIASTRADNKRLREALVKISSPSQTKELLWWQIEARAALKGEPHGD